MAPRNDSREARRYPERPIVGVLAAVMRGDGELFEETGVSVEAAGPPTVIDTIERDEEGRVRYHYTLVAVIGH